MERGHMLTGSAPCRTPSFRELKSRIEKPGEAESWGPIRRRARRNGRRPKFDWQHPFSSAVRWIAPDNSDSASISASEDLGSSMQVGLALLTHQIVQIVSRLLRLQDLHAP